MAVVNKVQKSGLLNQWDIIKFQIMLDCHLNKISVSDSDLDCLTLLAINGESELTAFCNAACNEEERDRNHTLIYEKEILKSPQSVRNSINKIESKKLIVKNGKSKKTISVNPIMKIQTTGNIFIEVKFLYKDETQEA